MFLYVLFYIFISLMIFTKGITISYMIDYLSKYWKRKVLVRSGILKMFVYYKWEIRRYLKPSIDFDKHDSKTRQTNNISLNSILYQIVIFLMFSFLSVVFLLNVLSKNDSMKDFAIDCYCFVFYYTLITCGILLFIFVLIISFLKKE